MQRGARFQRDLRCVRITCASAQVRHAYSSLTSCNTVKSEMRGRDHCLSNVIEISPIDRLTSVVVTGTVDIVYVCVRVLRVRTCTCSCMQIFQAKKSTFIVIHLTLTVQKSTSSVVICYFHQRCAKSCQIHQRQRWKTSTVSIRLPQKFN
jgi:hypothetical protein